MKLPRHIAAIFLVLFVLSTSFLVIGDPNGVQILSNTTETPTPQPAASLTTSGGSFTTMILNATGQTLKWKAYVGNVTGSLKLQDSTNFSIYDWDLTTVSGEVYASRNTSITWSNIQCVTDGILQTEENQLNIGTLTVDSINQTFNDTVHAGFWVGTTQIAASNCRAIATYVNDTAQASDENADFQIILLDDTTKMVYTTILENDAQGYNNNLFDFQLIVAEDPTSVTPYTYYFWAELT